LFEKIQENLYKICKIPPAKAWMITPAEAEFRIRIDKEILEEENEYQQYIEARLCAVIMNANGARKEDDDSAFTVEDFLPQSSQEIPPELQDELNEIRMRRTVKALGGTEIITN
jgi:hypothetical protein